MRTLPTTALAKLAEARIFFALAPALMALLVIGTLAQQSAGIYDVQRTYFHAWVFWLYDFIPLPGGSTLIGLIGISLLIKTLLFSEWRLQKAGIITTHIGVLVLLFGGLFTTLFMKEGFVLLREGAEQNYYESYTERNLVVRNNENTQGYKLDTSVRWHGTLGIEIKNLCKNINIITRDTQPVTQPWGMAKFMALECATPMKEEEANISGLTFIHNGKTYIAFDGMKNVPALDDGRTISVERSRTELPFSIKLEKFIHENHPGTMMPARFTSNIILHDDAVEWPTVTDMNRPARYKGYTIFQSSFLEDADGSKASILSVVKNKARLLPYISTFIICLGLLLHLFLVRRKNV